MITVIGSVNMDLMVTANKIPANGETNLGTDFQTSPGGKGANQAVAASRLGADVKMIGCVGEDVFGRELVSSLQREKIDVSHMFQAGNEPTGIANVIVSEQDNRIIVVPGANYALNKEMIASLENVIQKSSHVVLQLEIRPEIVDIILNECRVNHVPVLLNPAPAEYFDLRWMDAITTLTPNEQECTYIFGTDIETALEQYPKRLIVTLGDEGARYFDGEKHVRIPSFQADVVDTTGAGDTFNGALAYAFTNGYSFDEAVLFANAAGSLAVEKMGAQSGMPEVSAVLDRMDS